MGREVAAYRPSNARTMPSRIRVPGTAGLSRWDGRPSVGLARCGSFQPPRERVSRSPRSGRASGRAIRSAFDPKRQVGDVPTEEQGRSAGRWHCARSRRNVSGEIDESKWTVSDALRFIEGLGIGSGSQESLQPLNCLRYAAISCGDCEHKKLTKISLLGTS